MSSYSSRSKYLTKKKEKNKRCLTNGIAFFIDSTSAHSVRTKCRNSARRPIDGVDFNAKCTQCALNLPMKNAIRLNDRQRKRKKVDKSAI